MKDFDCDELLKLREYVKDILDMEDEYLLGEMMTDPADVLEVMKSGFGIFYNLLNELIESHEA